MSLKLSKTNVAPYDFVNINGELPANPLVASVTIDKTGGTVTSPTVTAYLVGSNDGGVDIGSYSGITITPTTTSPGLTWEVSANGSTGWGASLSPADMDVSSVDVVTPLYFRVTADNSESTAVTTGNKAGIHTLVSTENPPALP